MTPAETFPPGLFITEEITARGWTTADLAARMGGDAALNQCKVDLLIAVPDKRLEMDEATAFGLARAFGTSPRLFINLDRAWRGLPALAEA